MSVKVFEGSNPSQIYMNALFSILRDGTEVGPRGKSTLELRPVTFAFTNPKSRVTFLKGRMINPFFQLAEALWILYGRSDVKWLTDFNSNMGQFSDDGKYFNAPYGERLRFWNKNDASGFILNPIDQLVDVYNKIQADTATRQAVATLYNPMFDHAFVETKDRPCNLTLAFKVRDNKLDLHVFNRSNDLHWGTFGANLCQFTTILETMASWLGVGIGTFYHTTDSLHVYLQDYGAEETKKVMTAYEICEMDIDNPFVKPPLVEQFVLPEEPRMRSSIGQFADILKYFFGALDPIASSTQVQEDPVIMHSLIEEMQLCADPYLRMSCLSTLAYRVHKAGNVESLFEIMGLIPDGSWKVSCLRFLSKKYLNMGEDIKERFRKLYCHTGMGVINYIERKDILG